MNYRQFEQEYFEIYFRYGWDIDANCVSIDEDLFNLARKIDDENLDSSEIYFQVKTDFQEVMHKCIEMEERIEDELYATDYNNVQQNEEGAREAEKWLKENNPEWWDQNKPVNSCSAWDTYRKTIKK